MIQLNEWLFYNLINNDFKYIAAYFLYGERENW